MSNFISQIEKRGRQFMICEILEALSALFSEIVTSNIYIYIYIYIYMQKRGGGKGNFESCFISFTWFHFIARSMISEGTIFLLAYITKRLRGRESDEGLTRKSLSESVEETSIIPWYDARYDADLARCVPEERFVPRSNPAPEICQIKSCPQ